jgi:hypothetical protein
LDEEIKNVLFSPNYVFLLFSPSDHHSFSWSDHFFLTIYYRKEKHLRFIALVGGFIFLALSPLIEFFILDLTDIALYDFVFLLSEISSTLGISLLVLTFFAHVSEYDRKI